MSTSCNVFGQRSGTSTCVQLPALFDADMRRAIHQGIDAAGSAPRDDGRIGRQLGLLDGQTSIAELQHQLRERYPDLFNSPEGVGAFVAEVVARCA